MLALAYAQMMGFGDRLREARKAAGLSGVELGRRLATTKTTISNWEHARHDPNVEQIKALCAELNVPVEWLFEAQHPTLSAEAMREAMFFEKLTAEERRRWRAVRMNMFPEPATA